MLKKLKRLKKTRAVILAEDEASLFFQATFFRYLAAERQNHSHQDVFRAVEEELLRSAQSAYGQGT